MQKVLLQKINLMDVRQNFVCIPNSHALPALLIFRELPPSRLKLHIFPVSLPHYTPPRKFHSSSEPTPFSSLQTLPLQGNPIIRRAQITQQ